MSKYIQSDRKLHSVVKHKTGEHIYPRRTVIVKEISKIYPQACETTKATHMTQFQTLLLQSPADV